jgi:signal transduction histidine kinase
LIILVSELDLSASQSSEARYRLLAEFSDALSVSLDDSTSLNLAARLIVPHLADVCTITVLDDSGEARQVVSLGVAPAPDASGAILDIPMITHGRRVGNVVLTRFHQEYSVEEVELSKELARRAAVAVENAYLHRAREDTLNVVSHDLRNPLNVISLALAMLNAANTPELRQKYMTKIGRSVERMNRLIDDLLDIAKVESNALSINRAPVDVRAMINDTYEMLRPLSDEKGVKLERVIDSGLPLLSADRDRILQVFSNLLGNAVKFTPPGGKIVLAATKSRGAVRFTITDTGPGIEEEHLARVFDRYWQGGRESRQGAGLGLAIAKGIVIAHGGRIAVESKLGVGTMFWFEIPEPPPVEQLFEANG